ncbi:DUF2147 domain-containing protein [Aureicoccus marinus]|uniref:DUF2147 domain-containing protein n=1 Tax=Aureicoccus marinus TaxID=754435 RepID=A0A2S7T743_9FLAO|nr:DUF2147 domain-containing protein [Aureicoccus marinus]PQJ15411.1 hypothetical protein BST99_06395 [Aureicoccus marinus]
MKKFLSLLVLLISANSFGQTILGQWETTDDKTGEKKALIEIYQKGDQYFAKILDSYISEEGKLCDRCKGSKKNQPIQGLVIIEGLEKDGDEFNGGTILDPENGKTYKCYLELVDKSKLKVRGYLGVSLLGRTQYWTRK